MHRVLPSMLCVVLLGLAAGCGATQPRVAVTVTTAPTARTATPPPGPPTPLDVPVGWQVYSGQHFAMAYPTGWTMATLPDTTPGLIEHTISLADPAAQPNTGQLFVNEAFGFSRSQLQAECPLQGTTVTLAGLSMKYTVGEGVHRNWLFVNSQGVAYTLDAMDADKPQAAQHQHDSILATFRPDDPTPGCA